MTREIVMALVWWAIATLTSVGCISWAMIWGWGMEPRSWLQIILAYCALQVSWSFTIWCKKKHLKYHGIKGEGAH
jgi:phosphotransferase system  glucose/maltose/N-acetylglucosamine-specific IIC component